MIEAVVPYRLGPCRRLLRRVRSVGRFQGDRIALATRGAVRRRTERRSSGICAWCAPVCLRHVRSFGPASHPIAGLSMTFPNSERSREVTKQERLTWRDLCGSGTATNPEIGGPAVNMLVCFYHLHARLWVQRAPGIPHALAIRGESFTHDSGASRRGNARCVLTSLRERLVHRSSTSEGGSDEAIHSFFPIAPWNLRFARNDVSRLFEN
jgi:hypothetical protein